MIILDKEGTLYSTARCTGGGRVCNLGRVLEMYDTKGTPSDEIVARLTNTGEWHERRHPSHTVEVTVYRETKVQPSQS